MIIRRCLRLVFFFFDILRRGRGPRTVAVALPLTIIASTSFRTGASSSFDRRTAASSSIPIPVPEVPLRSLRSLGSIVTITVPVSTSSRAARAVTAGSVGRRRARASVVAPDRGRRILRPLNTQSVSIEVPTVHIVIGILRVTSAAEFHEGITGYCSKERGEEFR